MAQATTLFHAYGLRQPKASAVSPPEGRGEKLLGRYSSQKSQRYVGPLTARGKDLVMFVKGAGEYRGHEGGAERAANLRNCGEHLCPHLCSDEVEVIDLTLAAAQ